MLQYLLSTTAIWLLCLMAFELLLRRESYHGYNRLYLVGTFLGGLIIPLCSWNDGYLYESGSTVARIAAAPQLVISHASPAAGNMWQDYLWVIYITGVVVSTLLLFVELYKIAQLFRTGHRTWEGAAIIIETGKDYSPFSMFHYVFVPSKDKYSDEEWDMLVIHEQMHGLLFHFADVVLFQVARIIFWFHPLVYSYQKRLLMIHEYQADKASAIEPARYGLFLVEQALLRSAPAIAHSFNRSPIKNRIFMLTRKSTSASRARMLVIMPLAVICVVCFSQKSFSQRIEKKGNTATFKGNTFELSEAAIDTVLVTDPVTGNESKIITMRDQRPLTINGQKIYDISEVEINPRFNSKDFTFRNYLITNLLKDLNELPDGSYSLGVSNIVIDAKGEIAYYDWNGIAKFYYSHGTDIPIPEEIKNKINNKINRILNHVTAQSAQLNGKKVPVFLFDPKLLNSIDIKNHKVTNWP